jgi:hypothetical protein
MRLRGCGKGQNVTSKKEILALEIYIKFKIEFAFSKSKFITG